MTGGLLSGRGSWILPGIFRFSRIQAENKIWQLCFLYMVAMLICIQRKGLGLSWSGSGLVWCGVIHRVSTSTEAGTQACCSWFLCIRVWSVEAVFICHLGILRGQRSSGLRPAGTWRKKHNVDVSGGITQLSIQKKEKSRHNFHFRWGIFPVLNSRIYWP